MDNEIGLLSANQLQIASIVQEWQTLKVKVLLYFLSLTMPKVDILEIGYQITSA